VIWLIALVVFSAETALGSRSPFWGRNLTTDYHDHTTAVPTWRSGSYLFLTECARESPVLGLAVRASFLHINMITVLALPDRDVSPACRAAWWIYFRPEAVPPALGVIASSERPGRLASPVTLTFLHLPDRFRDHRPRPRLESKSRIPREQWSRCHRVPDLGGPSLFLAGHDCSSARDLGADPTGAACAILRLWGSSLARSSQRFLVLLATSQPPVVGAYPRGDRRNLIQAGSEAATPSCESRIASRRRPSRNYCLLSR